MQIVSVNNSNFTENSFTREIMISWKVSLLFLIKLTWAIANQDPRYIPYLVKEPLGPEENGLLELDVMQNMDYEEKEVRLKLGWEYESSAVLNDIRSINNKQIENFASLRFNFETYNHDGWILFG